MQPLSRDHSRTKVVWVAIVGMGCFSLSTLFLFSHFHTSIQYDDHMTSMVRKEFTGVSSRKSVRKNEMEFTQVAKKESIVQQINFIDEAKQASENEDIMLNRHQSKTPFPQSIKNEEFEHINHPAIDLMPSLANNNSSTSQRLKQKIEVPKFWNPSFFPSDKDGNHDIRKLLGNYGERLLTKNETNMIGSHVIPSKDYDDQEAKIVEREEKGNDDQYVTVVQELLLEVPPKNVKPLETIFVSISSYRDPRCTHTVEKLFAQATYPERLRVAVVDQIMDSDDSCASMTKCKNDPSSSALCKYSHQVDRYVLDADLAVGPIFARHIGSRMYRGEYFAMQTDAHMEFVSGWDVDVIRQWESAKNEMAVLTTYVCEADKYYDEKSGKSLTKDRPKMCNTDFEEDSNSMVLVHGQQPQDDEIQEEPTLQPLWAAGFSFSRGHFLLQVPYDQYLPMVFQGEEINIGLRGFTYGYDYYAPQRSVLFHYYSHGGKQEVQNLHNFWENLSTYRGVKVLSEARIVGLSFGHAFGNEIINGEWNNTEERKYGLGKVRTVQKFLDTFGIDLKQRKVQHHMCQFVGKPMNSLFVSHLNKDSMGIDYSQISFKFQDPNLHGKTWEALM